MNSVIKIIFGKTLPYFIIALLCVIVWHNFQEINKHKEIAESLETTISDLNQEIKYTKIRLNDSIEVYQAEVKSLKMTKNNLSAKYDNLLKSIKIKPKDVNNVTEVTSVIHKVDTVYAEKDAFGGIIAEFQDPFININVEVKPDLQTIMDYSVRDSLTIVSVQKKHKWLFGLIKWTEQKSLKVINNNPNAQIVSLQTIDIIE